MGLLTASALYHKEVIRTSAGGTYDDIEIPRIDPGLALEVRHVSVENRTSNFTRLVIGPAKGNTFHQKEEVDSPVANDIYWTRSRMWVPEGWTLRARCTGCTSGDVLVMYVEGILYKVGG
jgi:hypothetical protein